jgi:hypothetical protein
MNKLLKHRIEWLRSRLISELISFLNIQEFEYRGLTNGEISIAQSVFGELDSLFRSKNFQYPLSTLATC